MQYESELACRPLEFCALPPSLRTNTTPAILSCLRELLQLIKQDFELQMSIEPSHNWKNSYVD